MNLSIHTRSTFGAHYNAVTATNGCFVSGMEQTCLCCAWCKPDAVPSDGNSLLRRWSVWL